MLRASEARLDRAFPKEVTLTSPPADARPIGE
jgi:hypothetical protein